MFKQKPREEGMHRRVKTVKTQEKLTNKKPSFCNIYDYLRLQSVD